MCCEKRECFECKHECRCRPNRCGCGCGFFNCLFGGVFNCGCNRGCGHCGRCGKRECCCDCGCGHCGGHDRGCGCGHCGGHCGCDIKEEKRGFCDERIEKYFD